MTTRNLLGDLPLTLLADDEECRAALVGGTPPAEVAAAHPDVSLPWAVLAEQALAGGRSIEGYAHARVGYHRGLDALRRSGWRGQGSVPWSHVPNRGFLRALAALARAPEAINEDAERDHCRQFVADCAAEAARAMFPAGPAA